MASYYPSFTYMGLNSLKDKHLRVVAFDADSGEVDTFLGIDAVYTDNYDGTKRIDYGAKYANVAMPKISVMKLDKTDFTVAEVRDFLKWTTGVRQISYLDLMAGNEVRFSLLGRVKNVSQQKLDSRTIGFTIEFESISPWAYSSEQYAGYSSDQTLAINSSGVVYSTSEQDTLTVSTNGVLYNNVGLSINGAGVVSVVDLKTIVINNKTDDLYTPIYLDAKIINGSLKNNIKIKNKELNEETVINNIVANETITLSNKQFIISDRDTRIFGSDFNYVWPRLQPGNNTLEVSTESSDVDIQFTYRYPIKIGDCAIDMNDLIDYCGDFSGSGSGGPTFDTEGMPSEDIVIQGAVPWSMIENTPTTLAGYGITDAYTTVQVDNKLSALDVNDNINENELNRMLDGIFKN